MYSEGIGVAGATGAAARMAEAHGKWGEKHYGAVEGVERDRRRRRGARGRARRLGHPPLRRVAQCGPFRDPPSGRAAQLMQILREWRGGIHLVATTAVGLSPLEAILTNEGPGQAKFFGWSEPFPDFAAIKAKHDEAEEMTDRLCASALADALETAKYARFEAGVTALRAATP